MRAGRDCRPSLRSIHANVDQPSLEIHSAHSAHATAAAHWYRWLVFGPLSNCRLGGNEQPSNRRRILQRGTNDLGRIDNTRLDEVFVLLGLLSATFCRLAKRPFRPLAALIHIPSADVIAHSILSMLARYNPDPARAVSAEHIGRVREALCCSNVQFGVRLGRDKRLSTFFTGRVRLALVAIPQRVAFRLRPIRETMRPPF